MKYFVPVLRFAQELPPQTAYQDKLGGIPWGLRSEDWPRCSDCGGSLSLLAQFAHHPERLDLGRPGRVLSIFQCNHHPGECKTWAGGHGANACFVTEPEDLSPGLTAVPADAPFIETEVQVVEWADQDDGLTLEEHRCFFDDATMPDDDDLMDKLEEKITPDTRLGGTPFWVQSSYEAPEEDWRFVGQLDYIYRLHAAPSPEVAKQILGGVSEAFEAANGQTHICPSPNFGDAGIGYVFLRKTEGTPEGWFFWQCY